MFSFLKKKAAPDIGQDTVFTEVGFADLFPPKAPAGT